VIIDDMPVVQQAQAFDNLADLQRIEVLKGPQGTLFGKNASAGVVNIVTKDPGRDFEGMCQRDRGNRRRRSHRGGRFGAAFGRRRSARDRLLPRFPGNVRNLTSGRKLNDQENYGFRRQAARRAWQRPGLHADRRLRQGACRTGATNTIRSVSGTGTPRVSAARRWPCSPSLAGITPGDDNYRARVDTAGATRNETASIAGKFNLDLGFANLISVTAYQDWKFHFETDFDGTDLDVLGGLTGGARSGGLVQSGPYHSTNFTQELRLVSVVARR
jgi:iron complex outermembrane receptor protein